MLKSNFIEDVFIEFYETSLTRGVQLQQQDQSAASSFYYVIAADKELTLNQANFLLKILQKYKMMMLSAGLDYRDVLDTPQWKRPFRVLDFSKKIFVEKDDLGSVWICAKFPYQLKKEFDAEFEDENNRYGWSSWDHERKLRRMNLYDINLIQLYEFSKKHNFEIDETFMIALGEVEEIWQNQEDILPSAMLVGNEIYLKNVSSEVEEWWNNRTVSSLADDLLLAKSMGFVLNKKPENIIEKIAASESNSFWIKNNREFFSLYNTISGRVCIVLDRTANTLEWLTEFIKDADAAGILRDEIKVCFRDSKEENSGINDWIRSVGVGGKVESGRLLIFEHKPAKWLFKNVNDVKLLVTNNLYPSTNQISKDWFSSHSCVIYLGDIKPSEKRGQKIVEL